jgi:hypothetical protein
VEPHEVSATDGRQVRGFHVCRIGLAAAQNEPIQFISEFEVCRGYNLATDIHEAHMICSEPSEIPTE